MNFFKRIMRLRTPAKSCKVTVEEAAIMSERQWAAIKGLPEEDRRRRTALGWAVVDAQSHDAGMQ